MTTPSPDTEFSSDARVGHSRRYGFDWISGLLYSISCLSRTSTATAIPSNVFFFLRPGHLHVSCGQNRDNRTTTSATHVIGCSAKIFQEFEKGVSHIGADDERLVVTARNGAKSRTLGRRSVVLPVSQPEPCRYAPKSWAEPMTKTHWCPRWSSG